MRAARRYEIARACGLCRFDILALLQRCGFKAVLGSVAEDWLVVLDTNTYAVIERD